MSIHPNPELLSAWVDQALRPPEASTIGDHVAGCDACQAEVEATRSLTAALAQLPPPPVPAGLEASISRAVLVEQRALAFGGRAFPVRHLTLAFAAVALASALILVPVVGVGLPSWLLWIGLSLKDAVMLFRDLLPVMKAVVLLAEQIYVPLVIVAALTAALPLALAGRMMGLGRPQLRGA